VESDSNKQWGGICAHSQGAIVKAPFFLIISLLLGCQKSTDSDQNALLARLIAKNSELVTINGLVRGPGAVKNAQVDLIAVPADGKCTNSEGKANGPAIATARSDASGAYSLTYTKQGKVLCVVVTPTDGSTMATTYGKKQDISWPGRLNLSSMFQEPTRSRRDASGNLTSSKRVNATPFTRIAATRFAASRASQTRALKNSTFYSAVRSVFPRAGEKSDEELLNQAYNDVGRSFFRGLNTPNFKIEEANPDSRAYGARTGAILTNAEKLGKPRGTQSTAFTGEASGEDLEKVLNYMADDFSDGKFDGKRVGAEGQEEPIPTQELNQVRLDTKSADAYLKGDYMDGLKDYTRLNPDISENFWRGIRLCDPDNQSCEESAAVESQVYTYPEDGAANVSSYFFIFVAFNEEIQTSSVQVQSEPGPCTGNIQISSDDFQSCMGGIVEADEFYAMVYSDVDSFQAGWNYKIRVLPSVTKLDGTTVLASNFTMSQGFTVAEASFTLDGYSDLLYHDASYAVWTACPMGMNAEGNALPICSGEIGTFRFCATLDDSCNYDATGAPAGPSSPVYEACEYLNTVEYGGLYGWRAPYAYEYYLLALDGTLAAAGGSIQNITNIYFWTGESDWSNPAQAYLFQNSTEEFAYYGANALDKAYTYNLLCVTNAVPFY
jgi:hypothetical protein